MFIWQKRNFLNDRILKNLMKIRYERLILKLVKLRIRFERLRKLVYLRPAINANYDIRITFFSKCIIVIDSSLLILMYCDKYLSNKNNKRVWKIIADQYSLAAPPVEGHIPIIDGLNQFNSMAFFHLIFSSFESSIRQIVKSIFSTLYSQKSYTFDGLLKEFLRELRIFGYAKFVKLISLVRNTIHNNGVYSPTFRKDRKSGQLIQKNTQVTWNKKSYKFIVNKPVTFINAWTFELLITDELLKMTKKIILHNKVILKSRIVDPFVS
jgi:hypothetical protein